MLMNKMKYKGIKAALLSGAEKEIICFFAAAEGNHVKVWRQSKKAHSPNNLLILNMHQRGGA